MGASVQFYGIENVMQAAENINCGCWAIFINSRLFTKHENNDETSSLQMLRTNLELLQSSNSNGVYTIKFFECPEGKSIKINEKTVCDAGSFNFKLIEVEQMGLQPGQSYNPYANNAFITGLQKELLELKAFKEEMEAAANDDEDNEENSITGALIGLIKRPNDFAVFVNTLRAAVGMPVQNIGMITGVNAGAVEIIPEEQKLERLATSIDTLAEGDNDFVQRMEKLAQMKKDDPNQYNMLLSMLGK